MPKATSKISVATWFKLSLLHPLWCLHHLNVQFPIPPNCLPLHLENAYTSHLPHLQRGYRLITPESLAWAPTSPCTRWIGPLSCHNSLGKKRRLSYTPEATKPKGYIRKNLNHMLKGKQHSENRITWGQFCSIDGNRQIRPCHVSVI